MQAPRLTHQIMRNLIKFYRNEYMNNVIKLEEIGQFILSIALFSSLDYAWWVFPLLLLTPDISMIGYVWNTKVGAVLYNIFHHKLLGILLLIIGFYGEINGLSLVGIIIFGHAALDRIFGYGLKFSDNFKHTHLGWIGSENSDGN